MTKNKTAGAERVPGKLRVLVCGYRRDEAGGVYFWVPECMGGAVYGREGCTCERRGSRRVKRRRA